MSYHKATNILQLYRLPKLSIYVCVLHTNAHPMRMNVDSLVVRGLEQRELKSK